MQKNGWTIIVLAAVALGVTVALPLSDALTAHPTTTHSAVTVGGGPDSGFPYD